MLNLQLRVKFKDSISEAAGKNPLKLLNAALAVFHNLRPSAATAASSLSFPLH